MYNEEIKERFLKEYCTTTEVYRTRHGLFTITEPGELSVDKDVASMSIAEAKSAIDEMDVSGLSTVYNLRMVIKAYIDWCKDNGVFETNDGFLQVCNPDLDISPSISRILFRDENDLIYSMRKVCAFNEGYPQPVIMAFAWLGLQLKDILDLRDSHVNLETRQVFDPDGNIIVDGFSDRITDILREFEETSISQRENHTTIYDVVKDLSTDAYLKRFLPKSSKKFGGEYTTSQIYSALNRYNQKYKELGFPSRLSFSNVWKSGRYYKLWEWEQATGLSAFQQENKQKILEIFRNSANYSSVIWYYKAYKRAFNL